MLKITYHLKEIGDSPINVVLSYTDGSRRVGEPIGRISSERGSWGQVDVWVFTPTGTAATVTFDDPIRDTNLARLKQGIDRWLFTSIVGHSGDGSR